MAKGQELPYQELFETPGISPLSARPRKHRRQRPNLRRKARGRPQMLQRLRCWVENLGFLFVLAIFAVVAIFSFVGLSANRFWLLALSSLALCTSTNLISALLSICRGVLTLFASFILKLIANCQLLSCLLPKRHSKMLEQCPCLVVVTRRGHDRYVHALQLVHFRVIDFREDQLVAQAQRVIAATVK